MSAVMAPRFFICMKRVRRAPVVLSGTELVRTAPRHSLYNPYVFAAAADRFAAARQFCLARNDDSSAVVKTAKGEGPPS